MLPNHYVCTGCNEEFFFPFRYVHYYIGSSPIGSRVTDSDLLEVPVRPAWCNACGSLCIAEDIATLRAFEDAYACVRSGQPVEYPTYTEHLDRPKSVDVMGRYLHWRMQRQHTARALCCGGSNFQFMDVAQPLFKHAGCDFGVIEERFYVSPYCGPGPGVRSPANFHVYNTEGELVGLLTWWKHEEEAWEMEKLAYPPVMDD